jgi:FKBP-type peptidyl-prolyl cis-trans isomerase
MLALSAAKAAARKLAGRADNQETQAPQNFFGGTVDIEIVGTKGGKLPRCDRSSSDPFVEVTVGEEGDPAHQTLRTTTKKKELRPQWNETLTLDFPSWDDCRKARVKVRVWDWDLVGSNDLMAEADLGPLESRAGALIRTDPARPHARVNPGPWAGDHGYPIKGIEEKRALILENKTRGKDKAIKMPALTVVVKVSGFPRRSLYNEMMKRKNAAALAEKRRREDEREARRQAQMKVMKAQRREERRRERALRDAERRRLSEAPASERVLEPEQWERALEKADLADGGWRLVPFARGDQKNFPTSGDIVKLHYEARLAGALDASGGIDSSYARNEAYTFKLGNGEAVTGWEHALPQMSVGQVAFVCCGPAFAYGTEGLPPVVPKMSTIVYQIELICFCDAEAQSHIPAALAAKPPLPDDDGTGPSMEARIKAARTKEAVKETVKADAP